MDHLQKSQAALEIADKTMEKTVFWGMIFMFAIVVFGTTKGMLGEFSDLLIAYLNIAM